MRRKAAITTRILSLVHQLCIKRIHVTKRDLFYTDVKLFEASARTHIRYACARTTRVGVARAALCVWRGLHTERARPCPLPCAQDQAQSDTILDDLSCMLGCTRSSLHGGWASERRVRCPGMRLPWHEQVQRP